MKEQIIALTIREGQIPLGPPCQHVPCGDPAVSILELFVRDSHWLLWSCQGHAEDLEVQLAGGGMAS